MVLLVFIQRYRAQWDGDQRGDGGGEKAAFGGVPQDIEGVYADGKFTVVQSRPQIL